MTFFYNLNQKLDEIRATPEVKSGQLNERANSPVEEGRLGDMARKVGGAVKKVAGKALDTLGHGSDEDLIRGMQKRAGMPQTGKKPMATPKEGVAEAATSASISKVLRLIERQHSDWFDTYGLGEVEDAVVDMAGMGKFQGLSAEDAVALVGQELESLYGEGGMSEGVDQEAFAALAPPKN